MFIIDLLAVIPFDVMLELLDHESNDLRIDPVNAQLTKLFKLFRLLRISKVIVYLNLPEDTKAVSGFRFICSGTQTGKYHVLPVSLRPLSRLFLVLRGQQERLVVPSS